jgi:acyl carrier protein/GNAT superfamily N-acetyltransferase
VLSEAEREVASVLLRVLLGASVHEVNVTPSSDFWQLGGDSLTATLTLAALEATFGVRLSLAQLRATPTIGGLAVALAVGGTTGGAPNKGETDHGSVAGSTSAAIVTLTEDYLHATASLFATCFAAREPLAAALQVTVEELEAFGSQELLPSCCASGLSAVAVLPDGTVTGFCLAEDLGAGASPPLDEASGPHESHSGGANDEEASPSVAEGSESAVDVEQAAPRLGVAFALLEELEGRYLAAHASDAVPGATLHIIATGVSDSVVDGAPLAGALEAKVLDAAKERGFSSALTVCTHVVTERLAREAGFVECDAVEYDTYTHGGVAVLAGRVPAPHTRAVLMRRAL